MSVDSTTKSKILIVEDEIKLAQLLADYLLLASFEPVMLHSGDQVEDWLSDNSCNLILLDLMLPEKDGMEICRSIRKTSNIPIIMVTARVEEIDRLLGLEIGADDYICKPYSPREVVARVKAVLRRTTVISSRPETGLELNENRFEVSCGDKKCELTKVEFNLFKKLVENMGHIFSRDQLMDSIYANQHVVNDRTIDSHIKKLRKKLIALGLKGETIQSVYGAGYRYEPTD